MDDETVIVKKRSGESVVLNTDDTIDYIDKDGQVLSKKDKAKGVKLDLSKTGFKQVSEIQVSDLSSKSKF